MKRNAIICIILSLLACGGYAQDFSEDLTVLSKLNTDTLEKRTFASAKNNTNEIQLLLSGAFLFYKSNISTQDGSKCAFHISCSEYALLAIKKQGLVLGTINFFDRFSRCHTCSPYQYKINSTSYRFDDPVQ